MNDAASRIFIYHRLYLACLAGMTVFLCITVFAAVRIRIWEVSAFYKRAGLWRTKKQKKRGEIKKMGRKNAGKRGRKTAVLTKALFLGAIILETMFPGKPASAAKAENGGDIRTEEGFTEEPVLADIHYTDAVRLVDESGRREDIEDAQPEAGYTAYYNDTLKISFAIQEDGGAFRDEENGYKPELYKDGERTPMPEIDWEESKDGKQGGSFYIEKDETEHSTDGAYVFHVGNYISPVLILDTTAPDIEISYEKIRGEGPPTPVDWETEEDRICYNEPVRMIVTVKDTNGRYRELRDALKEAEVTDFSGNRLEGSFQLSVDAITPDNRTSKEGVRWEFLLSSDANYTIPIYYEDLAGNRATDTKERLTVDTTPPEVTLLFESEPLSSLNAVNYREHGFWFSDGELRVKASAEDKVSGIKSISFTVTDENGEENRWEELPEEGVFTAQSFKIPFQGTDFKGTVEMEVCDCAGNKTREIRGCITESAQRHESAGNAQIVTRTAPSRTVGGIDYYNTDVRLLVSLEDEWSGIGKFSCTAGDTVLEAADYQKEAGKDFSDTPTEGITYEYEEELVLEAETNNENGIEVRAEYTDNAGHTGSAEQIYHIDITKPVITVEYDNDHPSGGRFYDTARTAVVTVRERNFDANDVEFTITGTDGAMPVIGDWSESGFGDGMEHVCLVNFCEDGDYTFSVSFEDLAGNWADYDRIDEFTIDKTPPILTVTWDNNESEHGFYYAEGRNAAVDILERNFNPELIQVDILKDGQKMPFTALWRDGGMEDHHRLEIGFDEDGDYSLYISGTDETGHALGEYGPERFVIDRTPPELEIFGVEDESANKGEIVPGVRCYDKNLDAEEGISFSLKKYKGEVVKPAHAGADEAGNWEALWGDFPHLPESDGLYTVEAAVRDLAGNQSEVKAAFSVNRFGSAYVFDEATDRLAGESGTYYTSREQDIVVTETNVDTLQYKEITCNHDGRLKVLEEGRDYMAAVRDGGNGWKQYTYTIYRGNFREEGTYVLTIYSEDRAKNISDNSSKGKRIEFAVDRTAPDILISGVEDRGQYRAGSREVTLDVQDNLQIESVEALVNGVGRIYTAEELAASDGKIVFSIGSANHFQSLRVTARDRAGNENSTKEMRFLLTSNIFIQFFWNRTFLAGSAGTLSLLLAGILRYLRNVRRFRQ